MNVLLTTDDGIHSRGVHVLFKELWQFSNVVMVVPDREQSAVSHSISLHRPLRLQKIRKNVYIVDGTPVDCVNLGIYEVMRNCVPDLVIAGINAGLNIGEDVHYSGTVAAALDARMHNISGIAFSLKSSGSGTFNFNAVAGWVRKVLTRFFPQRRKKDEIYTLNVNFPGVSEAHAIRGIRVTRLCTRRYPGKVTCEPDPLGRLYYWLGGSAPVAEEDRQSDLDAVMKKYISVTPLQPDMTDARIYRKLKK